MLVSGRVYPVYPDFPNKKTPPLCLTVRSGMSSCRMRWYLGILSIHHFLVHFLREDSVSPQNPPCLSHFFAGSVVDRILYFLDNSNKSAVDQRCGLRWQAICGRRGGSRRKEALVTWTVGRPSEGSKKSANFGENHPDESQLVIAYDDF